MALTWGTLFGGIALVSMVAARVMRLELPWSEESTSMLIVATRWAFIGVLGGGLFGLAVIAAGKRRSLGEMSVRRFGAIGFGIGASLPMLGAALFAGVAAIATPAMVLSALPISLICGTVSGLVAAVSLEVARAPRPVLKGDTPRSLPPVV